MMDKSTQTDAQMASLTTSISNLEVQMGQISQVLNFRQKGALPSNPVAIILKNLVEEKDKKAKEFQDNTVAVNFTPQSKIGKMLMAKCRTLFEETEEIETRLMKEDA
ncbi:FKBP12-interacting protein of 37 kDa-like [Solanum stenotomum]|uniref:FKBP12-interacting protein of 37 kDa-like n=1 Tax=Solanum stenotomum TaxID=172797 RepID=UPI0020D1D244|nr:FKBP12-interacting protein of 37 kDa-like [Solanum stenotomum]